MHNAASHYSNPKNRNRLRDVPAYLKPHPLARLGLAGSSAGTWQVDEKTGERTGAYYCDKLPAWRELDRPRSHVEICGWYVDSFASETCEPHVLQLPSRGGELLYVPATHRTDCDGVTLYLGDIVRGAPNGDAYDNSNTLEGKAWQRANRCAELEAERSREDDAKFQAERRCKEMRDESAQLLAQILADRAALAEHPLAEMVALAESGEHADAFKGAARAAHALRERIASARAERAHLSVRRRELRSNFWLAVEG
jgi:hypothetical protein